MFKLSTIVLLLFAVYYTQCHPAETSKIDTKAKTGEKVRLYINNGTGAIKSEMAPAIHNLEVEDQEINAELNAVLPYLNFLFQPDQKNGGLDDCFDQVEVQMVHEN